MRFVQPRTPLLAAALATAALVAPPLACADVSRGHDGAAVVPVHRVGDQSAGEFLAEPLLQFYEASADAPPPPPPEPCQIVGTRHPALIYGFGDEPITCVVSAGTTVVIRALGVACSDVEEPPYFGGDEAAQRGCDLAWATSSVSEYRVRVDRQPPVDVDKPRFADFSPQTTVQVPPDHPFGLPAGPGTFVAYGWLAQVRGLSPGRHTISVHIAGTDFDERTSIVVEVLRGGHSGA